MTVVPGLGRRLPRLQMTWGPPSGTADLMTPQWGQLPLTLSRSSTGYRLPLPATGYRSSRLSNGEIMSSRLLARNVRRAYRPGLKPSGARLSSPFDAVREGTPQKECRIRERSLQMQLTPELILAFATLVTSVSGLVWAFRRKR